MKIKHRASEEEKARTERFIQELARKQGVSLRDLYRITPTLAARLRKEK